MKQLLVIGVAVITAGVGCSIGGEGGIERIPSDEPGVDERLDGLEIICESTLRVGGTYEQTRPQPDDMSGCWEVGFWTVTWELDFQGCSPQPAFLEEFRYEARRDDDENADSAVTWLDEPDNDRVNLKISAQGSDCAGGFSHFGSAGDDRVEISLHPVLLDDGTLEGIGTWTLYHEDPF